MNICVNKQYLTELYNNIEKRVQNIDFDKSNRYAVLKKTVIMRFIQYGLEDIDEAQYERAVYVHKCIEKMADELENGDMSYWDENPEANGAKIDGYSMINGDGRPVFYCGYGHFNEIKEDVPNLSDFGCNTIQIEIGPYDIMFPGGTHDKWDMSDNSAFADGEEFIKIIGEYEINIDIIKKDVIRVLERAQRHNVGVCLLVSPHYIPGWFFAKYPDTRSKYPGFLKQCIYNPKMKEFLEIYLKTLMECIKDYPALQSICITNEPGFDPSFDCSDEQIITHALLPTDELEIKGKNMLYEWHKHLRESFKNIDELNSTFQTEFEDFSQVNMPKEDNSPCFCHWQKWNNKNFGDWHAWLAGIVKSIAPHVPVHAKPIAVFGSSEDPFFRRMLRGGVDPEIFAGFSDFSGNDCFSFEGRKHLPLSYKLSWYDFLTSLKRMPIDNTEDHVIEDRDNNYSPIQAKRIYADIWQGAIHGRTLTQLWQWRRSNFSPATANGSILHRPDCIEAVGRASLDLNRLAYEATALQNCERKVAILYSAVSRIYNWDYTAEVFRAYEGVLYAGFRPYFLTENNIDKLDDFEMLVIPAAKNVYKKTAEKIARYKKPVIVIDCDRTVLTRDEYDRPLNDIVVFEKAIYIDSSSSKVSPDSTMSQQITDTVLSVMQNDVSVKADDGNIYNIEWCVTEYNGKTLVNICSYCYETRKVHIECKNKKIKACCDIITGKSFDGVIELEPFTPVLIEI